MSQAAAERIKGAKSPAITLLQQVWDHCCHSTPFAWERLNHAMGNALSLAVGSGLQFAEGDFAYIDRVFRFSYWGGVSGQHGLGEGFYSQAILEGNLSACQAFEKWKKRPAFIVDQVCPRGARRGYAHNVGLRKRGRVGVGFEFVWKGLEVKVTSFSEDGSYLTACSYRKDPVEEKPCESCGHRTYHYWRQQIDRRFRITVEEIRRERKRLRDLQRQHEAVAREAQEQSGVALEDERSIT
jgi:hypothetical protein